MLGWIAVQWELGEAYAAVAAMFALELMGLWMDRRPVPGRFPVLTFFCRRISLFVLAIISVFAAMALIMAAAQLNKPLVCRKDETWGCLALNTLRSVAVGGLAIFLVAAIAGGGMALHPGLPETCSPTSWWLGAAGFARLVALAALPTTFFSSLDNFYQAGGWGLLLAAVVMASGTGGRCALAAILRRRSSWPLPWLAFVAAWAARLSLELLVHLRMQPSALLRTALAMAAQLLAGALAGVLVIAPSPQQPPESAPPEAEAGRVLRAANRRRQPREPARRGKRLLAAAIGMIAGLGLSALRWETHALCALRLAACGIFTAAAAGCLVQQLPFVRDLSAASFATGPDDPP